MQFLFNLATVKWTHVCCENSSVCQLLFDKKLNSYHDTVSMGYLLKSCAECQTNMSLKVSLA